MSYSDPVQRILDELVGEIKIMNIGLNSICKDLNTIHGDMRFNAWLRYNIHVDSIDRTPSQFLSRGFAEIMGNESNVSVCPHCNKEISHD